MDHRETRSNGYDGSPTLPGTRNELFRSEHIVTSQADPHFSSIPSVSWHRPSVRFCRLGRVTRDFLILNGKPNCWGSGVRPRAAALCRVPPLTSGFLVQPTHKAIMTFPYWPCLGYMTDTPHRCIMFKLITDLAMSNVQNPPRRHLYATNIDYFQLENCFNGVLIFLSSSFFAFFSIQIGMYVPPTMLSFILFTLMFHIVVLHAHS